MYRRLIQRSERGRRKPGEISVMEARGEEF